MQPSLVIKWIKSNVVMHLVVVAIVSLFGVAPTQVFANDLDVSSYEKLFWRGRPINIHLQTGVEHLIRFPSPVQIGVPPNLSSNVSVESAANVVYLTAKTDFDAARLRFRRLDTGTIYLFNIRSSKEGSSSLTELVDAQTSNDEVSEAAEGSSPGKPGKTPYGYVTLTRFAFQKVYAPDRLIEDLKGVSQRTLKSKQPLRHLIPGTEVAAVPWAQWTTPNGLYVTAVYLSNMANQSVQLDPRNFRHSKEWLSTSLFAGHLTPHNALGDSTTMVVISESPWEDSIAWLR